MIEFKPLFYTLVAPLIGLISLFGWSHRHLREKIDKLDDRLDHVVPEHKVRLIVDDKLAPLRVQYKALDNRIRDVEHYCEKIEYKVDKILDILRNGK